ncbi:hypothetical protein BC628DRAFT_1328924 [Trametes gibbosa]|nr:hypothetical protein BC628DRAFT_1328924 [Trametes gibbosa]
MLLRIHAHVFGRYDARLLLDALPDVSTPAPVTEPGSPGGWSDLPSDAEDTFFFSPDEIEDYRRDKRRRVIHEDRQARLRAIRAEAPDDDDDVLADPRENWGGSDEEPDDTQRELMQRTATHVLASPNPAQLEMRILANHGADSRFAFLRGRWARAWRLIKTKTRLEREAAVARERISEHKETAGIGGLAGYGDSDEDSEGGGHNDGAEAEEHSISQPPEQEAQARSKEIEVPGADSDDTLKAARRARAREWAEKRRMAKALNCDPQ